MSATAAVNSPFWRRSAIGVAWSASTTLVVRPSAAQSAATFSATAWSDRVHRRVRAQDLERVGGLRAGRPELAVDLRPAGLLQGRGGGLRVGRDRGRRRRVERPGRRRDRRVGDRRPRPERVADDRGPVDRLEQRQPDRGIAQLGMCRALVQDHGRERRPRVAQLARRGRLGEVGRVGGRETRHRVELAVAERRVQPGRVARRTGTPSGRSPAPGRTVGASAPSSRAGRRGSSAGWRRRPRGCRAGPTPPARGRRGCRRARSGRTGPSRPAPGRTGRRRARRPARH